MKRFTLLGRFAVFLCLTAVLIFQAAADPPDILRDYRFITPRSIVHVAGGSPNYDMDLSIAGKFGLVTGYDYGVDPTAHIPSLEPFAKFVDVHAILFNPLSAAPLPLPGWDLDKTLNLTGLDGTFSDPSMLQFTGVDGQGIPIRLRATIHAPLIHIVGANVPPPTCVDCQQYLSYQVDALGLQRSAADFNADGVIDAGDYLVWRKLQPTSSMTADDGNQIDIGPSDFFDLWKSEFGQTVDSTGGAAGTSLSNVSAPEPTALALLLSATALIAVGGRRCNNSAPR
ncbi:MAG TPA: hypothetical protein VHE81_13835 [Lacipirellulaceae bacterium]|nr:hypothetical protein [Lacipirellulaceae bacterium]